jgi:predicted enzyme related to lactoylglutathione lyase
MRALNLSSFVLFVSDVAKSKEFYVTVPDQEVAMEVGALNIGFKSALSIWDKAYATNTIFGSEARSRTDHECIEIYFETDGIDAIAEKTFMPKEIVQTVLERK